MVCINETSSKKGHSYITLVCNQNRQIIFVYERKSSEIMDRLAVWLKVHDEKRENIGFVSCDFGGAHPSGVRQNFPKARIVYDEFHVVKLIIEVMDNITRRAVEIQAINARTGHLIRRNVSKLSKEQLRTLEHFIENYRELAEDYRLNNVFSDIYRQYDKESA